MLYRGVRCVSEPVLSLPKDARCAPKDVRLRGARRPRRKHEAHNEGHRLLSCFSQLRRIFQKIVLWYKTSSTRSLKKQAFRPTKHNKCWALWQTSSKKNFRWWAGRLIRCWERVRKALVPAAPLPIRLATLVARWGSETFHPAGRRDFFCGYVRRLAICSFCCRPQCFIAVRTIRFYNPLELVP